jgi:HPt (histidine-containing phosphotransfer) domain-containing protein
MKYEYFMHSDYRELFQMSLNNAADIQKLALDAYASQTSDFLRIWKRIPGISSLPGELMFEAANRSLEMFVEMQKSVLDLVTGNLQSPAAVEKHDDEEQAAKVADRIIELVNKAERSAAKQEKVLDAVQHKNKELKPIVSEAKKLKKAAAAKHKTRM